jgi:FMN-dependent NADH-azoreductase
MIVLHIDSSASGYASVSRQLSAAAVETLRAGHENVQVKYRDLAANPPAHLSSELLGALRPLPGNPSAPAAHIAAELELTETLIDELLQADVLVLGVPMYNFSIPSPLKAWIDRVAQPGRTFSYTEKGPVGLTRGKKALIISSRGGPSPARRWKRHWTIRKPISRR